MSAINVIPQLPNIESDLSDIISDLQGIGGGLADAQIIEQTVPPEVWKGAAAHAYTGELEALKEKVNVLSEKARACAQELQPFRDKLSEIRNKVSAWQMDYDEAERSYTHAVLIDSNKAIIENWTQTQFDKVEAKHRKERDDKQNSIEKAYKDSITELDQIGEKIANKLAEYMNELVPAESRGSREAVGKAYLSNMPLVGGKARLDYERKRAKEAKIELKKVIDNDPPDFREFNAKWGEDMVNNPYFALSFMLELKGEGLDHSMRETLGNGWKQGAIDQDHFMENIGSAYIIASGSRRDSEFDGATAAAAVKWRSTSWLPDLIETGRKRTGISYNGKNVAYAYGYYLQSQLLAAGSQKLGFTPNVDYFATVGKDISRLDWKNNHDPKILHVSHGSWDLFETASSGNLIMYNKHLDNKSEYPDDSMRIFVDVAAKDQNSPENLQALLLSDVRSDEIEFPYDKDGKINQKYNRYWLMSPGDLNNYINRSGYESNVNYLIKERGASFGADNDFRASQMHEALGKAVQIQSARHKDTAAMAMTSEYLDAYANLTGGKESSGYELRNSSNDVIQKRKIGDDLKTSRVYISNVIANNINDVCSTFEGKANTVHLQKGIVVENGHVGLRFGFQSDQKGFYPLIDELAKDRPGNLDIGIARDENGDFVIHDQKKLNKFKANPTALQRIILASINEGGNQVGNNIDGKDTTSTEDIVEGHSNLLKYITGADNKAEGAIEKKKDDINSFVASAAEAGIGILPIPGGRIISSVGSFGLSQAGGQLMEMIFPTDNEAKVHKNSSDTKEHLETLFNQSVTRNIIKYANYDGIATPEEYAGWYARNYGLNVNDIKFWYIDSNGHMRLMSMDDIKNCSPNTKAAYYDYINSTGRNGEPKGLRSKYAEVYQRIHDNFK